jgi:hypothetical protein
VLRAESVDCAFNKETAYIKPNKSVTMETSQGRKIQWKLGIRTTAKHVCIRNVSRQVKYVPTIIYLLEGGYSIRTGYKRYQNCHSSLEYEFDTGDVSTRLSFDEIRERLSDISDDILVYAVDMLIQKLVSIWQVIAYSKVNRKHVYYGTRDG